MDNVTELNPQPFKFACNEERIVLVKRCGDENRTITLTPEEGQRLLEALTIWSQPWEPAS